jgi:hypothetical protein
VTRTHSETVRRLSARRVRELAQVGSWWDDGKHWWRVRVIPRVGAVMLERAGADPVVVTLRELGLYYVPGEDG